MLLNAIGIATRELRRNLLRSALTMLGIIIGVGAVILMVTVGNAANAWVAESVASLGSDILTLTPGQARRGPGGASANAKPFTHADVDALKRDVVGVAWVAPTASEPMAVVHGNRNRSASVTGTTNAYFSVNNWPLASGRLFTEAELRAGRAVCIIGRTVWTELFGSGDPVGLRIRLRGLSCEVIGVLTSKGQSAFGQDRDDTVVMPVRTFERRILGRDDVLQVQMSVMGPEAKAGARLAVERLMRERRRLGPADVDDFNVLDMAEVASTLDNVTRMLTVLLAAVAAVSLLVGGIGIMNIMLVSVTERTREIGIRMAIGALEGEVLTQFLVEAVGLSTIGGTVGIVLAVGLSAGVTRLLDLPFAVDPVVVIGAFLFSAAVGIVFGFVPARRAAALSPIDALRHE